MKWICIPDPEKVAIGPYVGIEIILLTYSEAMKLPYNTNIVDIYGNKDMFRPGIDMDFRTKDGIDYVSFGLVPELTFEKKQALIEELTNSVNRIKRNLVDLTTDQLNNKLADVSRSLKYEESNISLKLEHSLLIEEMKKRGL